VISKFVRSLFRETPFVIGNPICDEVEVICHDKHQKEDNMYKVEEKNAFILWLVSTIQCSVYRSKSCNRKNFFTTIKKLDTT
jgi:hypothetical protein